MPALVLSTLMKEVELLRQGSSPRSGKFEHFRAALNLENFHRFRLWVKSSLNREMFSNLEEITLLEQGHQNGDRAELVLQCCLFLKVSSRLKLFNDENLTSDPIWIFKHTRTLEAIAYLRFRLNSIEYRSALQRTLHLEMLIAVRQCVGDALATWEGMLLVLKVAGPSIESSLITLFTSALWERPITDAEAGDESILGFRFGFI